MKIIKSHSWTRLYKVTYFHLLSDYRTRGGMQSPRHGVPTTPQTQPLQGLGWRVTTATSRPSLVGSVPKPCSHSSTLLAEVRVPLPHFSCSSVWGPMWPWPFSLQSTPISYAPLAGTSQPRSLGGPARPEQDDASSPRYCTFYYNTAVAQIPGRHNAPGLSINFILNQLSARFPPSSH